MNSLDVARFPERRDQVAARWHAVQIEPTPSSGERLTIGVVAISETEFLVKAAPALDRLHCLYDNYADAVVGAASLSLEALDSFLAKGARDVTEFKPPFLSIHFGEPRPATGQTLEAIADQALSLSSSLSLMRPRQMVVRSMVEAIAVSESDRPLPQDPLTRKVRELVVLKRPGLADAFNRPLPTRVAKRAPRIGFVGARSVANFNVMRPQAISNSFQRIRNSFWALLLHRDLESLFRDADHRV
jgi:hypothetical protein